MYNYSVSNFQIINMDFLELANVLKSSEIEHHMQMWLTHPYTKLLWDFFLNIKWLLQAGVGH